VALSTDTAKQPLHGTYWHWELMLFKGPTPRM